MVSNAVREREAIVDAIIRASARGVAPLIRDEKDCAVLCIRKDP